MAHLPTHLAAADHQQALQELLADYRFLEAKLPALGPQLLIDDYALAADHAAGEAAESLRLIGDALGQSAHVLATDPEQLPSQLVGRLLTQQQPQVQALLASVRPGEGCPWLRPLTASLTPPGGPLVRTLTGHTGWVRAVAVTADGRTAVSGSGDHTLKVWDLDRGTERTTLRGHTDEVTAVAVTADGRTAVSVSDDGTLKVWDLARGAERATLTGHTGPVTAVAVTPDGRTAVSGSWDHTLKVWDLDRGTERATLTGHTGPVTAVAVTADGRTAVSGSSNDTLTVWDLDRGTECFTITAGFSAVAVTADGRTAVSGSRDGTLKVWDLERGVVRATLTGHTGSVKAVAVTADGRTAVSGSWGDDILTVWDLDRGTERATLTGHSRWVEAVALTVDGRTAVSGSKDCTLKVWDLASGDIITSFSGEGVILACAVAPDGLTVVAGDGSGRVHILRLENITPGPPVLTAWHSPEQGDQAFGCTHCRTWSEIPSAALGTELPCPHCGKRVKLNPFTVEADWRPVAAAWSERGRTQSPSQ